MAEAEDQPLAGSHVAPDQRQSRVTAWAASLVERNHVWFEHIFPLVLSLGTLMISATFAVFAWRLSTTQIEVAQIQNEIQRSQANPIFVFEQELTRDDDGTITTALFSLSNEGGLAIEASVGLYSVTTFTFYDYSAQNDQISFEAVSLGLFAPYEERAEFDGTLLEWGSTDNIAQLIAAQTYLTDEMYRRYGNRVSVYTQGLLDISYTDFLGRERTLYYRVNLSERRPDEEIVFRLIGEVRPEGWSTAERTALISDDYVFTIGDQPSYDQLIDRMYHDRFLPALQNREQPSPAASPVSAPYSENSEGDRQRASMIGARCPSSATSSLHCAVRTG